MEDLLEKFPPKCQGVNCTNSMEYYAISLNKYFWGKCVSMNMVDEESVKVPNPWGIYGNIVSRKSLLHYPSLKTQNNLINKVALD